MSIFDFVKSTELVAYWETLSQDRDPYIGEELFPDKKKLGLDLKWIKGSKGLPIVLKTSAFDAQAVPRDRIAFDKLYSEMPFFKESLYIDEELRQQLNMVIETGNDAYIDSVVNRVFDDEMSLLEGAAAARERMRMMALTTGVVSMTSNGQVFSFDYGVPSGHKSEVTVSWSSPDATVVEDIRAALDKVQDDTGVRPSRAICNRKTWGYILNNNAIKKSVFVLTNGVGALNDARLRQYLMDELELEVVVNDKRYKDESGNVKKYVPDDTFAMFPSGDLGSTWFGTTPEESDLMGTGAANVSITDTGVAVTTIQKADPVNVETKVTMICLPSFEAADQIYILDVKQGA